MPSYTDKNGYLRDSYGDLVHRRIAYEKIFLKHKPKYILPFADYHIHHKDGNKQNNGIRNLDIVTKEEHDKIHELGLKGKKELNEYLTKKNKKPKVKKVKKVKTKLKKQVVANLLEEAKSKALIKEFEEEYEKKYNEYLEEQLNEEPEETWRCNLCKGEFTLKKRENMILEKGGGVWVDCPHCEGRILCSYKKREPLVYKPLFWILLFFSYYIFMAVLEFDELIATSILFLIFLLLILKGLLRR